MRKPTYYLSTAPLKVCEFKEYRINHGSNGTRDLIIKTIKKDYDIN